MNDRRAEDAPAPVLRVLARGVTRRCPRCGGGRLFSWWFRMVPRCPRCDYVFARDEGFLLGAFVVNFGVTIVGLALIMGVLIAVLASGGSSRAIGATAVAAALEAVVVPIVFYPVSKTLWTAVDLVMHRGEAWARLDTSPGTAPDGAAAGGAANGGAATGG